ncbi:MAG: DUF5985 family protein [Thermoleophilaceae bacterium]
MATAVYILSALISLACAVLLLRSYVQARTALLLWAAICFLGLTLNNAVLFVDKVVATDVDLSLWRAIPALAGMLALVFGLLWEESRP